MIRLTVYRTRIRLPMQTTRSEVRIVMNSIFSHASKTEGASFLRGLTASNPSGMWTVRYNYCTSHNSLKRYSCLWTLAINGVAVSPAILRPAEGTECEKVRNTKAKRTRNERRREKDGEENPSRVRARVLIISIIASTVMCMLLIPLDF